MQASTSIAASLNPFAATPANGQAVGAAQGLEGLLAGLFGGEDGTTDAGATDAFSEALAAALCAPTQAQPVQSAQAARPEDAADAAPVAPAAAQGVIFAPALLANDAAMAPAPVGPGVEGASPEAAPQVAGDTTTPAVSPDLKLVLAAAKETVTPAALPPVATAPTEQKVAAPIPTPASASVEPAVASDAAAAVAAARQEPAPQVQSQAAAQVAATTARPGSAQPEAHAKIAAKGKTAAPAGEVRGESQAGGKPATAGPAAPDAPSALPDADPDTDFAALSDAPSHDVSPDAPSVPAASHHEVRAAHTSAAEAPRATSQTVAHLAAQITSKLDGKSTRFDVQLDPHGLGKVDVKVEIAANGSVSAALTFENPQAAAELRGKQGELQAALEQAGFDLSKTSLSFNSGGQGQQGLFNQQQQHAQAPVWRGRAFTDLSDTPETAPAPVRQRAATGVDVRI